MENASTTNIEETNKTNEEPKRNEAIAAEKVASNDTVAKSDQNKDLVTKDSAQQANTAKEEVAKTASPQSVDNKNEAPKSTTSESHEGKQEVTNASVNQSNGNKEVRETSAKTEETPAVNVSVLREKLAGLESQVERIHGNQNQLSHIQNAEKLLAEAKKFLESAATSQKEVDVKAKEISSLTSILKSIKAEEVTKENKNKDSRNGKKMEEGTGFRTGEEAAATSATTSTTTGVGADVVDATETPAVKRPPYTERKVAEELAKQITWLDFSDVNSWKNVTVENGNVYLQEGSIYEKEIMPNYIIKLKVKSLKPFQATEIYRKRMEANNATPEQKATFNPNATNGMIGRTDNNPVRITAQAQDGWSEIKYNGINTNGRKTSIRAVGDGNNIGVQFEVSGTYKGNPVRPAVAMADAESAAPHEVITFTTNGSGWQQIIELKKNRGDARRYTPSNYYKNDNGIINVGAGNKIVPKFFTNPDQETGGLGTGVFGPGMTYNEYGVPVVMTKNATEVGMYVFSSAAQTAMIGVVPIDEGDAPETYGEATHTMNTRDGLTGAEIKQPYLGSERPDADTGNPKNWHGDDDTDTADAKYTPTVNPFIVVVVDQESKNIQGLPQEETPTFTLPEDASNATITSRKLVDPADPTNTPKDTVTLDGKGTFRIDGNGKVTFTPEPAYTGDVPSITVKATITVTNDKGESATIDSEAHYKPVIVPLELEKSPVKTRNLQGLEQKGTPTFTPKTIEVDGVPKTVSIEPGSYKLVKDNVEVAETTIPAYKKNTTEQIGTYTLNPSTGEVTFTPTDKTYTGEVEPVAVQVTGTNGVKVQTTYTPEITPVTPTKEASETTDVQGKQQVSRIVLDTVETDADKAKTVNFNKGAEQVKLNPDTLTLLDASGSETNRVATDDGEYVLDKVSNTITFTPKKTFTGQAKPVRVQIKDANGTKVETTYTPTVTDVTMSSTDATSSALQGVTQTGRPSFTISSTEVSIAGYKLLNPTGNTPVDGNEVVVPNEGTYRIDPTTGEVTFVPNPGFTGPAAGISVQATDANGETASARYTPTVNPLKVTPKDKTSMNIQGEPQDGTPTFTLPAGVTNATVTSRKLVDPADKVEKDTVVISGKGTFTINRNGKVVFTPEPNYADDVPAITVKATITVTNDDNDIAKITSEATYRPIIIPAELEAAPAKTANVQGAPQTATPVFTPGKNTVNGQDVSVPFEATSKAKLIDPSKTGEEAEVTRLVVENQGTYTIDDNGVVTFTPLPTFKGEATEVSIVRKDKNGTPATAKYKPTVVGVTPSATVASTTKVQGATQEVTVSFTPGKATIGTAEKSVPMDPTAYKLLGGENGTTPLDTVPAMSEDGTKEVGTYTIKVVDGQPVVTFTPTDKTYAGKLKPVTVQGKDTNGSEATTTYTPVITPIVPTSENGTSSGPQGVEQTGRVTFNPGKEPGTENTPVAIDKTKMTLLGTDGTTPVESLTVSKDGKVIGTYTLVKDPNGLPTGEVKFTPTDKSYVGEVPPATVQVQDANGTPAKATYTPTLTKVTPTGKDTTSTGLQGKVQTGTPTFTPGTPEVPMDDESPATFEDGNITKTVDKVGTYTVAKDGTVTFTPDKDFVGEAPEVTVKRVDKNGTAVTAKYKPIVAKVLPTGEGSETEGAKGKPQTSTVVFDKKDEDKATVNFNKGDETVALNPSTLTLVDKNGNLSTEVKVPGEGTYTLVNNVITFTPEKDFAGKATGVTVQIKDINGTPLEKTYTPTVRPVTTFVDPAGNIITVDKNNKPVEGEVDGSKQPTKDIYGYKFVRTETDNKGNTKHIYEQAEGKSVKVTYVSTAGETLSDSQTVETKDKFIGTDYDASIEALKLERIEKDGKVYLLKERKADSATENGKLSDQEQTVTYVYEEVQEPASNQKYGNVVVVYKDKFGRPISGTTESGKEVTSTVIDTPNSPLATKYDTTDHKPQMITTKDGKKYKLIKVLKSSDAEKSGVKARTSVITYVYESLDNTTEYPEAHIGLVLVNYLDEEGNPISGKTPEGKVVPNVVVDTEADLVGKDYDTTDYKVSTIIVENGDVYELLKASETSVEKGKLTEGATNVNYIYRKVVTKFVDENGKEIKSPEKGRTDKKDIPEYTFKEMKKDASGNTVYVYAKKSTPTPEQSKLTIWADKNGNLIKVEKGTKEHGTVPGYEFVRTIVDDEGNTIHIYHKVSSTIPEIKDKDKLYVEGNPEIVHSTNKESDSEDFVKTNPEQRINELPNTGTKENASLLGLGILGALSGFGLLGRKKKED